MLQELFMPHPILTNYAANHLGEVINITNGKTVDGTIDGGGYSSFFLPIPPGQRVTKKRHVLVWEAFNGIVLKGNEVYNKDGSKDNNRLGNLESLSKLQHHQETDRMKPQRKEKTTQYISIQEAAR